MKALDRADAIWSALDEALNASTDHCARCKTCAVQTAAVFAAIHEAGYVLVSREGPVVHSPSTPEKVEEQP
jgi:hypothetical protein